MRELKKIVTQDWTLDKEMAREDFVTANKEGLASLMGYLSIFYFARAVGKFIAKTG